MSEPLVSEGRNIEQLLATIRRQYGEAADVLYTDRVRRGGVCGFFAREVHRVVYRLDGDGLADGGLADGGADEAAAPSIPVDELPALTELLGAVDTIEQAANSPVLDRSVTDQYAKDDPAGGADFARVLQALAAQSEQDDSPPPPTLTPPPQRSAPPPARTRVEMLMQLRDVGVPVLVNPSGDADSIYQAVGDILGELPPAPTPPRGAGEILVLVGELAPALRAARSVVSSLRVEADAIRVAGAPPELGGYLSFGGCRGAARLGAELRGADGPSVVVIATDAGECDPNDPWPREMLQALRATAVWAVIDATRKTEDARAQLGRLGTVDALAVHSAQLSASPATVWDLDLPIALLDSRPASAAAWSGLLFGLLQPDLSTHGGTAQCSVGQYSC